MNKHFIEKVAKNIKKHRKVKGLNQIETAFRANIGLSTLASIETARNDITLSKLEAIAKALGVEPFELLK